MVYEMNTRGESAF
jgi:hypothetical protein